MAEHLMTIHARVSFGRRADAYRLDAPPGKAKNQFMERTWRTPRELSLAAACCIWPQSERRLGAVREAAVQPLDWDRFLRVVRRQRVAGLVHDGLTRASVAIPIATKRLLAAMAMGDARQNLKFAAEALRLQAVFEEARIPILFVKGVTLAHLVYGNIGIRHSKDIDFLVSPQDAPAALKLLDEAGYKRIQPPAELSDAQFWRWFPIGKECEFVHRESGVQIELHWRLTNNPFLLRGDIGQTQRVVPLAGRPGLRTLSNEELFPYLCAHGANDAWFRLKWLADIGAILEQKNQADIESLYWSAESRGVGRCAAQAMLLCERLFKTPLPSDLLKRFNESRLLRCLEGMAFDALAGGGAHREMEDRPFGTTRINLSQYLLRRGWRYRLAEFRNQFTNIEDMMLLRLPPNLAFLYPWLRIPLWLWRRASRVGRKPLRGSKVS